MLNITREVIHHAAATFFLILLIVAVVWATAVIIYGLSVIGSALGESGADIINQSIYVIIILFAFMLAAMGLAGSGRFKRFVDV